FLLNDTMAIIGTPVVLLFASREKISPKLMLLTLAFAITIGSVASPIGNPQNLLIASNGIAGKSPFVAFFSYLLLPTVINLFIAYLVLRTFYKKEFHSKPLIHANVEIKDRQLALASKISLVLLAVSILASILVIELGIPVSFNLAYIAVISALPIVLFSKRRFSIIKNIDWTTIVFFVALFVLVGSVWQCGFFQALLGKLNVNIESIPTILIASVIGSQLVSNVPMVIIYLKLIAYTHISARAAMALAAGSTIAGNLFILGAASNVIIIQNAEKRHNQTLSFFDFAKVGVVVTVLNVMVYWAFLTL
ncbi:MAG: anion transporter, partial [Candidatus Micrarchaeota archaeon]|nr:anion transporter [Candidatus Micrarchaeota archaeon]